MVQWKTFLAGITFFILSLPLMGCRPAHEFKGSTIDPPLPIPDFDLTAADGQPFHLSDIEGDLALIYFGYTFCPDFCPLTLSKVAEVLTTLETGRDNVQVLFISVDPERDTPDTMRTYLGRYNDRYGTNFIGLTGEWEKLEAAMQPFGVYAAKEEATGSAAGYLVSHTASLFLVSPQREWILHYSFEAEAEDLRSDLAYLLRQ